MSEAEALDEAAEAAGWGSWGGALRSANRGVIEAIRAHAKTIMENAALKAEIERLRGYAVHLPYCQSCISLHENPRLCGLTALIKEIEGD